jgi:hypothetical protein
MNTFEQIKSSVVWSNTGMACRSLAEQWWETDRPNYELVTSQYFLDEAADGDAEVGSPCTSRWWHTTK